MFKKRNRTISFRVSEDEYEQLQRQSLEKGAHSVSEYARTLTCHSGMSGSHVEIEVRDLHGQVEELSRELLRLSRLLEGRA